MIVIGLVGRIGAGKSTVARRFAELGATVIDADRIAHEVLAEESVVAALEERFGPGVLDPQGRVARRRIAERVFGPGPDGARELAWLEALVHPRVHRRIAAALETCRREGVGVTVLDVPLLVQAGWERTCTRIVVVECPDAIRRSRLAARGWSAEEQEAREAAWNRRYAADELPAAKTTTVDTSGDLAYTRSQVDSIWSQLPG
jgi:dephospho-CoA kinase